MDPRRRSGASGLTPLVQQRLPGDIALKIGGNHRRVFGDTLPGGSGDMRRDNHVIELDDKRMIAPQRFAVLDIQRRAAQRAVAQGINQRCLVDHRRARGIDQQRAGLHAV